MTVDGSLAARRELREALAELAAEHPELATPEAQERLAAALEHEKECHFSLVGRDAEPICPAKPTPDFPP